MVSPPGSAGRRARSMPVDSFLESKLRRPPTRGELVERSRLCDLLDRAAARPISLVAAPAGFGKTTLVAQWLNSRRPAAASAASVFLDAGTMIPVDCGATSRRPWNEQAACWVMTWRRSWP